MPRVVALLVLFAAAGCSDPTVDVSVVVPTAPRDYGVELATLAVSVLATEDLAFDCDAIAYGEISDDALALAEVTGVTLQRDEGTTATAIAGVPRLGRKLWLAEGRRSDGLDIIAGCTEQGDIEDDTVVTILAEPVAHLAAAQQFADAPVPAALHVVVDDGFDDPEPLPGRAVRWNVFGAGGVTFASDQPMLTDEAGAVDLELEQPEVFGPASIQVRARWARDQPAVVAAFQGVPVIAQSINRTCTGAVDGTLAVDAATWGQFRLDERVAIAGLAKDTTRTRLYVAAWDGAAVADTCSLDLPAVTSFAILRGGTSDPADRLLIMTATEWIENEVTSTGDTIALTPRPPIAWTNPTGVAPVSVVTMRACGRDDGDFDYVLAQLADDTILAFDPEGQPVTKLFATNLIAHLPALGVGLVKPRLARSGCIAQGLGMPPVQALILAFTRISDGVLALPRYLVIDDPVEHYTGLLISSFGAVAFTGVSLMEPLLLGGAIDPSGAKVVRWQLTPGDAGLELREVARDDSLGPPASVALGNIDGDGELDTVWGLVDAVQGGAEEARLQLSLGCGAGDLALNSVSGELESPGAAVFLAPSGPNRADLLVGGSRFAVFLDTDLKAGEP